MSQGDEVTTQEIWLHAWSYIVSDGYQIIYGSVTEATATIYFSRGTHYWNDFTKEPSSGIMYSQSNIIWIR